MKSKALIAIGLVFVAIVLLIGIAPASKLPPHSNANTDTNPFTDTQAYSN